MKTDTAACDLCGRGSFQIIGREDRHGQPLATRICRHCGLVAHLNIPDEDELRLYYSETYRKNYHGESQPSSRRVMRAWTNGQRILRKVAPLIPTAGRVLEVGAGIGCTVKSFERAGFQAEGIDPGGEFARFAQKSLCADVKVCSLSDLPDGQSYDAVLLVHVIEHLASPRSAVRKLSRVLKPGGLLYIECPNLQAPFARRGRLFHVAHIHNFVPTTLRVLAESCGFRLQQRFSDDRDPNLQMLFQYTGEPRLIVPVNNYERTLADLRLSDWVPYHLRLRYLTERIQKLTGYAVEYIRAKSFVDRLISECGKPKTGQSRVVPGTAESSALRAG